MKKINIDYVSIFASGLMLGLVIGYVQHQNGVTPEDLQREKSKQDTLISESKKLANSNKSLKNEVHKIKNIITELETKLKSKEGRITEIQQLNRELANINNKEEIEIDPDYLEQKKLMANSKKDWQEAVTFNKKLDHLNKYSTLHMIAPELFPDEGNSFNNLDNSELDMVFTQAYQNHHNNVHNHLLDNIIKNNLNEKNIKQFIPQLENLVSVSDEFNREILFHDLKGPINILKQRIASGDIDPLELGIVLDFNVKEFEDVALENIKLSKVGSITAYDILKNAGSEKVNGFPLEEIYYNLNHNGMSQQVIHSEGRLLAKHLLNEGKREGLDVLLEYMKVKEVDNTWGNAGIYWTFEFGKMFNHKGSAGKLMAHIKENKGQLIFQEGKWQLQQGVQ